MLAATDTWPTSGAKTITVMAANAGGAVSDTHVITLNPRSGLEVTIDPILGGSLLYVSAEGRSMTIQVPPGAVTATITLAFTPVETATSPSGLDFSG